MTFETAQNQPTAENFFVAEVTTYYNLDGWTLHAGTTYAHALAHRPVGVRWQPGDDLAAAADLAACEAAQGSWYWSKTERVLYVNPAADAEEMIFDSAIQAELLLLFANRSRVLEAGFAEDRMKSVPRLSLRIEDRFGGVAQTGAGSVQFSNADGFFDDLAQRCAWNAGKVILRMGIDANGSKMAEEDFRLLASWQIEDYKLDDLAFSLDLSERKNNLRRKLPLNSFTREEFPRVKESLIGKKIPIAYGRCFGVPALVIDEGDRRFKVTDHAVSEFLAVRVERKRDAEDPVTPATDAWSLFSGTTYRMQTGRDLIRVEWGGVSLEEMDSVADTLATASSYYRVEGYLYVNVGANPASGSLVTVYKLASSYWQTVNFETRDKPNGEFTLSAAVWSGDEVVSVDFDGKPGEDGRPIYNPAAIVKDLLATIEETDLDEDGFEAARDYFLLGLDVFCREKHLLKPSLYVSDEKEAMELLSTVNQVAGSFLYVDAQGRWFFKAFEPQPATGLAVFESIDLIDLDQEARVDKLVSKAVVTYAQRIAEKWSERVEAVDERIQKRNAAALPLEREVAAALWDRDDARYFAQRLLTTESVPLRILTAKLPRQAFGLVPGEQIAIRYARRQGVRGVFEILEVAHDLQSSSVTLKLGDLRGWATSSGFWVGDDEIEEWPSAGTEDEKRDAAATAGFLTDDNGFADPTDGKSRDVSRWW